ncbi:hypothetical protein [Arthrobacter ruber]|uniref:hypothetical protein n=1 Tax=Arthrobacter ruber TaxID=1258893 RepID=UPI0012FFD325|nr:hypothetical protein [Arthrobacter ruber]
MSDAAGVPVRAVLSMAHGVPSGNRRHGMVAASHGRPGGNRRRTGAAASWPSDDVRVMTPPAL